MDDFEIEIPPRDVVPRSEITPTVAELLAGAVGTQVTVHFPGELIETLDDEPLGVTESTTVTAILASVRINPEENPR